MLRSPDRRAIAFLVLMVVALYGDILFFGRGLYLSDILSYHIPMKWIVREVVRGGAFPFWNPFYSAGQPMAANPAYEVFYPPQWLIWLPSFHFGFQLHILLHFVIAALGMYLLLRGLEASPVAATFGAAVFVMSGPYLSLSSKLPLLFSLSWMPLVLEFTRRTIETRSRKAFAIAAVAAAMQLVIGEPTIVVQTWLLIAGSLAWQRKWRDGALVGGIALAAVLVAAVQLFPAFDFARDSVRSEPFEFRVVSNWSMPPERPIEMALPAFFRHVSGENGAPAITTMYPFRTDAFIVEMYVGVFVVMLVAAGLLSGSAGAGAAAAIVVTSIVVAIGDHTPLLRLLYGVHLFRSIRYPEKFILAGAFAIIVWSALLLDRLLKQDRKLIRTLSAAAAIWLIVMLIALASAGGNRTYFAQQSLRAAVLFVIPIVVRRWKPAAIAMIFAFVLVDLWFATRATVPRMPREFFDAPPLARSIPKGARIYPEAYWQLFTRDPDALAWTQNRSDETYWWLARNGMNDHLPARFGYELVLEDDTDRTSLKNTDALRTAMFNLREQHVPGAVEPFIKMSGAAVELQYRSVDPSVTNASTPVEPVARDYRKYAFADRIQRVSDLPELLGNLDLERGLSSVAFADTEPFVPASGEVTRVDEKPNSIALDVRANGPAFLILSVTAHRYWSATLDGNAANLIPAQIAYQGIRVPGGAHRIDMLYRNPWILPSAIVTLLALAALALIASGAGMRRRASSRA